VEQYEQLATAALGLYHVEHIFAHLPRYKNNIASLKLGQDDWAQKGRYFLKILQKCNNLKAF